MPSNINKFWTQGAHALYTIEQVLQTLEGKREETRSTERWGAVDLSCSRGEVLERPPDLPLFCGLLYLFADFHGDGEGKQRDESEYFLV